MAPLALPRPLFGAMMVRCVKTWSSQSIYIFCRVNGALSCDRLLGLLTRHELSRCCALEYSKSSSIPPVHQLTSNILEVSQRMLDTTT